MVTYKNTLVFIFLILFSINMAGCSDKGSKAQKPAAKAPAAQETTAHVPAPKEESKVEKEVYSYDPKGRRDPFAPLIEEAKDKPKTKKGLNPVENFDVEEIKLVAIASDKKQFYAMIILPDKKSYTIRKGMVLGLYGGKVEEITAKTVLIREQIKDYKGQLKTKDTILRLRKEGEE